MEAFENIVKVIYVKQRVISALLGLLLLAVVLFMYQTIALNVIISLISLIGVYEILKSLSYDKNHKYLLVAGVLFAAVVPFFKTPWFQLPVSMVVFVFIVLLVTMLFKHHNTLMLKDIAVSFVMSMAIPMSLSSLLFIRDLYDDNNSAYLGLIYIIFALGAAWFSDTGAYFTGKLFGKHKLAPVISPKKTVEGAIGGIILNVVCFLVLSAAYQAIIGNFGIDIKINYIAVAVIGLLSSPAGMIGDLFFSVIKRQNNIKDFGTIMPGHGGILDRFDSVIMTAPFIFFALTVYQPIGVI